MNLLYELPSSSRRKAIQPKSQPGSRLHALPSRIHIFHNILWPKYKGLIFSGIHSITSTGNLDIAFFQIARTSSDRKNLADVDTSYHRYPYELLFDSAYDAIPKLTLCKRLFSQVWRSDADLVVLPGYHLIEYWMMLLACVLTRKKRAVFVDSTGNDQPDTKWKYLAKRLFFSLCDGFFAYGQRSKEYLLSFHVPAWKITTRCQAAALPHAYSPEHALQERVSRRNDSMPPSFLFVGLLSEGKGIDLLLRAFRKLRQNHPSATLTIVGDGPMRDELKALAASLDVADAVRFPGAADIEQLAGHYLNASCLVLPSRSEAWGLVVNEALSYGCPAIVSAHCGCAPDLIFEGKTGHVFRTNDADDLAAKMTLVVNNMNNVPAVARDCIELMRKFTPQTAAMQILNGCRAILDNRREAA